MMYSYRASEPCEPQSCDANCKGLVFVQQWRDKETITRGREIVGKCEDGDRGCSCHTDDKYYFGFYTNLAKIKLP